LRQAQCRHTGQARDLISPFVKLFLDEVTAVAESHEHKQRELSELYGLEFKPSLLLCFFKQVQLDLASGALVAGSSPDDFVWFINDPTSEVADENNDSNSEIEDAKK
jgi:hypothetical protein